MERKLNIEAARLISSWVGNPPDTGRHIRGLHANDWSREGYRNFQEIDCDFLLEERQPGQQSERYWIWGDAEPEAAWPLKVGYFMPESRDGTPLLIRVDSIEPKLLRGRAKVFSKYMVVLRVVRLDRKAIMAGSVLAFLNDRWVLADTSRHWKGGEGEAIPQVYGWEPDEQHHIDMLIRVATTAALKRRYEWHVEIGNPGFPTVLFRVGVDALRHLFEDREVSAETERRDVLLNWVSQHWRRITRNPEVESYVRQHLRGALKFDWRGFEVKLHPAVFDLERNMRLAAERELLRLSGEDRRPRVT
jgi:hypothetical protein